MCVCVCACVYAYVCVCVRVCVLEDNFYELAFFLLCGSQGLKSGHCSHIGIWLALPYFSLSIFYYCKVTSKILY